MSAGVHKISISGLAVKQTRPSIRGSRAWLLLLFWESNRSTARWVISVISTNRQVVKKEGILPLASPKTAGFHHFGKSFLDYLAVLQSKLGQTDPCSSFLLPSYCKRSAVTSPRARHSLTSPHRHRYFDAEQNPITFRSNPSSGAAHFLPEQQREMPVSPTSAFRDAAVQRAATPPSM